MTPYHEHSTIQRYLAHEMIQLCWYEHKQQEPSSYSENDVNMKKIPEYEKYEHTKQKQKATHWVVLKEHMLLKSVSTSGAR